MSINVEGPHEGKGEGRERSLDAENKVLKKVEELVTPLPWQLSLAHF